MQNKLTARDFSMVIALAGIWTFFAFMSPSFLSARNLSMLVIELSITAILALGMLLVLLPGHIDLSVGSGVGLFGGAAAVLVFIYHWPAILAMGVLAVAAVITWNLVGRLIVLERIPAFIVTLGGLLVFKGLHWLVIRNATVPVVAGGSTNLYSLLTTYYLPPLAGLALAFLAVAVIAWVQFRARAKRMNGDPNSQDGELVFMRTFIIAQLIFLPVLVTNQYRGVPLSVVILGIAALLIYGLTRHTPFGRYLYAIGGNEEAAFMSGIAVRNVVIGAFTITGLVVAITGFLQTAYAGASTSTIGSLMELDAIAACVIGGTSLRGGRGTVAGVLIGSLIMASLLNGMTLMAVSPEIKYISRGVVLILALWLDVKLSNRG